MRTTLPLLLALAILGSNHAAAQILRASNGNDLSSIATHARPTHTSVVFRMLVFSGEESTCSQTRTPFHTQADCRP